MLINETLFQVPDQSFDQQTGPSNDTEPIASHHYVSKWRDVILNTQSGICRQHHVHHLLAGNWKIK
jgi:hypothetical protein